MAQPVQHTRRQAEERDNLIDDDELAASLAKARRAKAKKAVSKITPEQIAKNLAAQREAEEKEAAEREAGGSLDNLRNGQDSGAGTTGTGETGGGLTFDETSEFIRNVGQRQEQEPTVRRVKQETPAETSQNGTHIKEEPQEPSLAAAVDADSLLAVGPAEDGEVKDEEMDEGDFPTSPPPDSRSPEPSSLGIGTSAEPDVSGGMAGTLNLLRSQGLLDAVTPEQRQREAAQREYDLWKARRLAEQAVQEEERRMNKLQGSAKDQATREHENKLRELEDARRAEARFKDYKPDVDIKYHDQYGRVLDKHDAWKLLSHTFHGKAPGKAKQEKYKQKVMDERKRERMAAGEAQDMSKAFRERQQREGQAHMVLSVGAKGNAPQDFANHLGPNLVQARNAAASGSGSKASKGKTSAVAAGTSTDGRSLSQERGGLVSVMSESFSPMPSSSSTPLPSNGPRMRPAFQPIAASSSPAPGGASPAPASAEQGGAPGGLGLGGGFKLAFGGAGAQGKRKAEEQGRR
jgi:U4/U6.U5 tri-snRNP-associated protein 1